MAESVDREFRVEPLGKEHDRAAFSCGVESLDRYLRTQASQDMRRKANAVLVLVRSDVPATIVGYFTLCATTLSQNAVPEKARKHLPRYPLVSATLIGRLAVDHRHQGHGIDALLLARALRKAYAWATSASSGRSRKRSAAALRRGRRAGPASLQRTTLLPQVTWGSARNRLERSTVDNVQVPSVPTLDDTSGAQPSERPAHRLE